MKRVCLWTGPLLAITIAGGLVAGQACDRAVAWTVGITLLTAFWWITEPIPIAATSLVPLAVFPLSGVLDASQVAQSYGSPLILLMLGGFMLSTGMERSGAHRRIALTMVGLCGGTSGRRLVFGFMAASALLSMWISNAATTLMLLPIALAVLEGSTDHRLQKSLLLGIAYAASIGGIGTPIGTPPNLIFMSEYLQQTGIELGFIDWMKLALPLVLVMLPLAGLWLTRGLGTHGKITLPSVGSWRKAEVRTLVVFTITAFLWMTRQQPWGGWSAWSGMTGANDASVALLAVVALFAISDGQGARLLDWESATRIPWGILILFGGGITIANAFVSSGLSRQLGDVLAAAGQLPQVVLIGTICLAVTFLTEVTSNTATATLLMPILAAAAVATGKDPRLLMIPATFSASFAFMLPVATPPNAIVFASDKLVVREMAQEGFVLNLLGVVAVTTIYSWWL